MPNSLTVEDQQGKITRTIAVNVVAEIGGVEKRHPTGGLLYENTEKVSGLVPSGQIRRIHKGTYDEYNQDAKLGQLDLTLHYRLFPTAPFFELSVTFASNSSVVIRNIHIEVKTAKLPGALVNTPGNLIRRNLPIEQMGEVGLGIRFTH